MGSRGGFSDGGHSYTSGDGLRSGREGVGCCMVACLFGVGGGFIGCMVGSEAWRSDSGHSYTNWGGLCSGGSLACCDGEGRYSPACGALGSVLGCVDNKDVYRTPQLSS